MDYRRTVLVVEDSEVDAELLQRSLTGTIPTSAVVVAQTTHAAESYVFSESALAGGSQPSPDLVMLDVRIPPAGGLAFLDKLRRDSRTKNIPVVMISGDLREEEVRDLYRHGVNSYLDKPVDFHEFMSLVSSVARYWLHLNMSVSPRVAGAVEHSPHPL